MKSLKTDATENTLRIAFDAETGVMEIEGVSYPENAMDFFNPLDTWLRDYISEGRAVTLNLKVGYLNSSSTKCLLDFIQTLEEYHEGGGKANIAWYYEKDDEDIQEMGEDLAEDLTLPVELIPY
ncbi:MAG: hypothetical protein BWK80_14475 [Desulfobacteraceae bacterium IS3]|nr:MAG: hypothetical protein BWK80_14475 [Desulfobacteraceae bacterium IS3]